MSNETDEIEAIFDEIRELSDELGLQTTAYVEEGPDESMLSDILGEPAPRPRVRRRVAGGLAAVAVAASVVTVLTVGGDAGREQPSSEALSATLAVPSATPDTAKSRLDGYAAEESDLAQPQRTSGRAPATLAELAAASTRIVVAESDSPPVDDPSFGLRPGLAFTGRLVYFLQDGPGGTSWPIVPPYAETSPGVFVATAPTGNQVRRFTAEQLDKAIERR